MKFEKNADSWDIQNSEVVVEKMKFWLNWKLFDSWSVTLPKADISLVLKNFLLFIGLTNLEVLKYSVFPVLLFDYHILEKIYAWTL